MKTLKLLMVLMMVSFISLNTVSAQPSLQVTLTTTDPSCGAQDGSITANVTGGTGSYTYSWYDRFDHIIGTTQTISGLGVGVYYLSVMDANSVYGNANASLSNGVSATTSVTPEICNRHDGTATVSITGGTSPYNILWQDGQTTATATGLDGGRVYNVHVTDANGCIASLDTLGAYVYESNNVMFNTSSTDAVCSNATGSATVNVYNGVPPYSYYWNTVPVQTGATASNLLAGSYAVQVTDATGCMNSQIVTVNATSGTLEATATIVDAICGGAGGSISITPSGGTPPYSYLWEDASTASSRTGLTTGFYNVTISDNGGCSTKKNKLVGNASPVYVSISGTAAACDHTSGSVTAGAGGGTAPYTYVWNWNNSNTSSTLTNVSDGYYYVQVTDANGCVGGNYTYVPLDPSCINTVSGKAFQDLNSNCAFDAGEFPIVNYYLINHLASGESYYGGSDVQGNYTIYSDLGNYTVQPYGSYNNHTLACPVGGQYSLNGTSGPQAFNNMNFGLQPTVTKNDVRVAGYSYEARPGFQHSYLFFIQNIGTSPASGDLVVQHDANEVFLSAYPSANTYNSGASTITFNYSGLQIGEIRWYYVYTQLPPTVALGTVLVTNADISNAAGDDDMSNNSVQVKTTVIGSFDPNDITVSPEGVGNEGYIFREDAELTYHIRFQNTGTASAIFVKVVDTLDTDLNPNSLHDIVASHPYTLTIKDNRILEFFFENINLADSTSDYEGSNGFITYKVNQLNMLPMGTEITNKAYIFFDYNASVKTNTVLNTITTTAAVADPTATAARHKAYPVPAHNQLVIQSDVNYESVQVLDLTGRVVKSTSISGNAFETNVNDLAPGVYIYKIFVNGEAPMTGRVVIE